uniref:Uncharacterized protein n=1 Tax=Sphaerodactylus townsendi TaxID=933632 RepID=A0ACB8FWH8_9SAUR
MSQVPVGWKGKGRLSCQMVRCGLMGAARDQESSGLCASKAGGETAGTPQWAELLELMVMPEGRPDPGAGGESLFQAPGCGVSRCCRPCSAVQKFSWRSSSSPKPLFGRQPGSV